MGYDPFFIFKILEYFYYLSTDPRICAGGLKKKLNLRSGSQRHGYFVWFFNMPVQAPIRGHPFYTPDLSGRIMVWRVRLGVSLCVSWFVNKACKHNTDWTVPARTVKLGVHNTYDKRTNPIDFQGHRTKGKVTC